MWSIAICDDNRWERYALEEALESYGKERRIVIETELFQDGLMLYKKMCLGKHYDAWNGRDSGRERNSQGIRR